MRRTLLKITWMALLALVPGAAAACGDGEDEGDSTNPSLTAGTPEFVGKVEGGKALVAAAIGSGSARVFVCAPGSGGAAEWFNGEAGEESFKLASASGDAEIEAERSGEGFQGTVTLPGTEAQRLSLAPGVEGSGLYEVVQDERTTSGLSAANGRFELRHRSGGRVAGEVSPPAGESRSMQGKLEGRPQVGTYVAVVDTAAGAICAHGSSEGVKRGQPDPKLSFSVELGR